MISIKEVISSLLDQAQDKETMVPPDEPDSIFANDAAMLREAVRLLKAQEPVFPHMVDWSLYECPKCKTRVDKTYKYCKCCGQAVKWE